MRSMHRLVSPPQPQQLCVAPATLPRLRLRPRLPLAVRAHSSHVRPPHNFVQERNHITKRRSKMLFIQEGFLYKESRDTSEYLCSLAGKALDMASHIVDSANLNASDEISSETIRLTLRAYTVTLMQTADDAYNRVVTRKTITSFLGTLRGLASVTHILLEAALKSVSHKHPVDGSAEYAFNRDVEIMCREYNRRMTELQDDIDNNALTTPHPCDLVWWTIHRGMEATESIVGVMMARRRRALGNDDNSEVVE